MEDNWLEHCEKCKDKVKMVRNLDGKIIGVRCGIMLTNPYIYTEEDRPLKCGKTIEFEITEKYRFFGSIRAFELYNIDKKGVLGHLNDDKKYIFVENKYYKIYEYNKDGWVFKRIKDKEVK